MSIKNSSNVKLSSLFHVKRDDSGKRPEAPTGKCDIVMIGDRSGSMAQMGSGPVEGLIDFVQTQFKNVKAGSSIHMELVTFNDEQTIVFSKQLKQENKNIFGQIRENMRPRGFTMLYDTVVDALKRQEERLQKTQMTKLEMKLGHKISKIFVLVTDGEDNSSSRYTQQDVKEQIQQYQQEGGHAYFIAAEQDAIRSGARLGFKRDCSLQMSSSYQHSIEAFKAVTQVAQNVMSSKKTHFTPVQRQSSCSVEDSYKYDSSSSVPIFGKMTTPFC